MIGVLTIIAPSLQSTPGFGFVATQVNGYTTRVIDGLSSTARSQDVGIIYRAKESSDLRASFKQSPIVGHGLGYRYRNLGDGVSDALSFYGHNLYLWLGVKIGLVGLAVFLWAVIPPAWRWRRRGDLYMAAGAAVFGVMAAAFVAPPPYPAVACALGCLGYPATRRDSRERVAALGRGT